MMILVTAANGNQGKLLVPRLLAAGVSFRACVRSDSSAQALRDTGVTDVVVGDITDANVLERAMHGVEKVYHIGPTLDPKEKELGFAAVDAARAAGVKHFVFSSVLHAITTDLVQHEIKRDIEEYLLSSGLEFTILQPSNYMLPIRLRPVFEKGIFYLTSALDRYQSLVDLHDVTEVVATVLADSEHHAGATYELVAPGRYTAYEIATIIGEVVGREIPAERIDPDIFIKQYLGIDNLNESSYQVRAARAISARYSSHDFIGNPNVLTWLLGRKPTTYREFVQRQFDAVRATR
jgi:uncharacterized protein YbjT (DUF2867 family)